jgi:hypothetical protein
MTLRDYLLDNYGVCKATPCACVAGVWRGRACPHWQPLGATSYVELEQSQKIVKVTLDNVRAARIASEPDKVSHGPRANRRD